jgi:hypothetical protein
MSRQKFFLYLTLFLVIFMVTSIAVASVQSLTVNNNAVISSGQTMLTVSGMVTCTAGETVYYLDIDALQQRGNRSTTGQASVVHLDFWSGTGGSLPCTGYPVPWETTIMAGSPPINGLWQPGPVSVKARASVCHLVENPPWGGVDCENGEFSSFTMDARIHAGQ